MTIRSHLFSSAYLKAVLAIFSATKICVINVRSLFVIIFSTECNLIFNLCFSSLSLSVRIPNICTSALYIEAISAAIFTFCLLCRELSKANTIFRNPPLTSFVIVKTGISDRVTTRCALLPINISL